MARRRETAMAGDRTRQEEQDTRGEQFPREQGTLEERLRFLSLLVENSLDLILVADPDGVALYVNPRVEQVLGYARDEFLGMRVPDLLHPDDYDAIMAELASAASNPGIASGYAQGRYRHKDGSWVWIEGIAISLLDDPVVGGIICCGRDITERKRLENELRQYQILVENSLDMMAIINPDNTWRYVSPAFERVLGYRPEELVGSVSADLLHPDDREHVERAGEIEEVTRTRGPAPPIEYRYRHKDGSYRYLAVVLNNQLHDPSINGVIGSGRDITERKEAEAEIRHLNETLEQRVEERTAQLEAMVSKLEYQGRMLRESEEMFRTTFELAEVGMAHVSPDGRFLRVNRKLCEIVGYERDELLRLSFRNITHSDDLAKDLAHLQRMLEGEIDAYSAEKRYVKKDYSQVWVSLSTSLVRNASGEPGYFISVIEDISERKRAERLLRSLTPREAEVLRLLALGRTNREIAGEMLFSVGTVKNHVQHIIAKLGVSDRTQAAALAAELGLIRAEE